MKETCRFAAALLFILHPLPFPTYMKQRVKKVATFVVRWGIAIVGVWLVASNMNLHDTVLLLNPQTNLVQPTILARHADEGASQFDVVDPETGKTITVGRDRLINPPTQKTVKLGNGQTVPLLGMRLQGDINNNPVVSELLIKPAEPNQSPWISPRL